MRHNRHARALNREVHIPAPLEHQESAVVSPASRKVLRWGRRGGKTRTALHCGIVGHGPQGEWEKTLGEDEHRRTLRWTGPLHRAVAQGFHVYWIARDIPQFKILWIEEIKKRFDEHPLIKLNEEDKRVEFPNDGMLWARTAENIASVRGSGALLAGVIIDEAAWMDLESILRDVVLAALLDNDGWLILISTTNAGLDGNVAKRVPSYFNVICEEIARGERSDEWKEFHCTPFDNKKLSKKAIDELIAEYPAESISLKQEVFAELVAKGSELALAELDRERHFVSRFNPPDHWMRFGALDWGFGHPWSFGSYAIDETGRIYKLDTITGHRQRPDQIARSIKSAFPDVAKWAYLVAGSDIKQRHEGRVASDTQVPTVEEELNKHELLFTYIDDGPHSRAPRLNNMRRYVAWKGIGNDDPETGRPRDGEPGFVFMDTPGNRACFAQCESMVTDPKKRENPLKRDADPQTGANGDDMFDETMNALASRPWNTKPLYVFPTHKERLEKARKAARDRILGTPQDAPMMLEREDTDDLSDWTDDSVLSSGGMDGFM